MTKEELTSAVSAAKLETKLVLQMVYNALNIDQQKELIKNSDIRNLFNLYQIEYQKEVNEE